MLHLASEFHCQQCLSKKLEHSFVTASFILYEQMTDGMCLISLWKLMLYRQSKDINKMESFPLKSAMEEDTGII